MPEAFADQFTKLMGVAPFNWQKRLFLRFHGESGIPTAVDLPTGLGKTSVMAIWYLARQGGADLPRRLVYVVDRRAVVDQATTVAERIQQCTADKDLRISTLRGQHADNKEWCENPAATAIIVGTVDMIGSRLLFEGYGVTRKMRPYHAGLLGTDTLLVLDESHLVPPFERLLEQVATREDLGPKDEADRHIIPRFHLLSLSATGRARDDDAFHLLDEDYKDPVVKQRLEAKKRLTFAKAADKLDIELAKQAWALSDTGKRPVRILVYCNSRDVADKAKAAIEKLAKAAKYEIATELFVGARRVCEREAAADQLESLGFLSGSDKRPEKPSFVFATAAGEVGVDLDADHMVMDLVPFERIVQRLGRVNRLGNGDARIVVLHEGKPQPKKPEEPKPTEKRAILAWRSLGLLKKLRADVDEEGCHDASPGELVSLKEKHGEAVKEASTPDPLYPSLSRPLVDAWAMTSLKAHTGRPAVQPWLRGWVEDEEPQTTLVWRKYLPVRGESGGATPREITNFFAAAPLHLTEMLETETSRVLECLLARAGTIAAILDKDKTHREARDVAAAPPLGKQTIVAIALDRYGEDAKTWSVDDLVKVKGDSKAKEGMKRALWGVTLVLDTRLGGLGAGGLLDKAVAEPATTADTDEAWGKNLGFRVRSIAPDAVAEDVDWHKPYYFDLRCDDEGNPLRQLCVEKYKDATATEEELALTPRHAQLLDEHQAWTADKARAIVNALGMKESIADAIVLAARLHDEGKKADRWQRAFNAKAGGIYAKTKGPVRPKILGGYRHEFGSLAHVEKNNAFGTLPDDLKHLVLHLVAAHHGRARPLIDTEGGEGVPPSELVASARDVALRFARLQKHWGPWGLAWLEALLRAADQQASRANDERGEPDG